LRSSCRPFIKVIEILATGLQAEESNSKAAGAADQQAVLADNALYGDVRRQLEVCASVVESLTVEHHSSLNSSLKAMGAVAEHYNKTRSNVDRLREEVRECKALLQTGAHQADVRELWQRKAQYAQVLRMLDMLDMIKGATGKFDKLVRQRRFVAAVDLLNASLEAIFTRELVDVPAVASVRDDLLQRKGIILDTIVRELADTLFLRTATEFPANGGGSGSSGASSRTASRGGSVLMGRGRTAQKQLQNSSDNSSSTDLSASLQPSGRRGAADSSSSNTNKGASSSSSTVFVSFAGLQLDGTDFTDETERQLDDPACEFSTYMRLLVEAVRRLRNLHDIERHLLDRLCAEVDRLTAGHMQACAAAAAGGSSSSREGGLAAAAAGTVTDDNSTDVTRLTRYLRAVFEAFIRVLHNHVYLVGLVQLAKKRDAAASAQPGRFAEADSTRCREELPAAAWRHVQSHVITVLSRHLALPPPPQTPEAAAAAASSKERRGSGVGVGVAAAGAAKGLVSLALLRGGKSTDAAAASKGAAGAAAAEFDRERAAEFVRSCLLVKPSPVILISVFKHTLKFAALSQALLTALHKEATGQSVTASSTPALTSTTGISYTGSTSTSSTAAAAAARHGEAAKELKDFLHKAVQTSLLPYITQESAAVHSRISSDPDVFLPFSLEAPIKASAAAAAAVSSVRGAAAAAGSSSKSAAAAQEALDRAIRSGAARPGKGAETVQAHAALIFRAMTQIPSFAGDIGAALDTALENYYTVARDRFTEFCGQGAAYKRLVRSGDKVSAVMYYSFHIVLHTTSHNWCILITELKVRADV
jgi:Sec8 exocyst complex component specific domain